MKVGAVEETITVSAESPVVDMSEHHHPHRDDARGDGRDSDRAEHPGGRHHDSGDGPRAGGGGALSRDVGGSGNLQQSPLAVSRLGATRSRPSKVMRLNNLCAQGAYSGVYWNDGSFQEISYVTGADSAEMGQGGIRVNMVPKDGGNTFRGVVFGNYADLDGRQLRFAGIGRRARANLAGDLTFNPINRLTNVGNIEKIWDFNPVDRRSDRQGQGVVLLHLPALGRQQDRRRQFYADADPRPFRYVADRAKPGIDDGHIASSRRACVGAGLPEGQDHLLSRRSEQGTATTGASPPTCRPRPRRFR